MRCMPMEHATVAVIYDFDGTLTPKSMQENRFLPDVGIAPAVFWREVNDLARENHADQVLMYMHLMLEKANANHRPITRTTFHNHGRDMPFYPGVETWFDRIGTIGNQNGVTVEHYLISSGNDEIIRGTGIAEQFKRIYASQFLFDANEVAIWPAVAVNYTDKTQFLFRINKGALDIDDESGVNRFISQRERPMPFERMIYIGDGETDIPAFRTVRSQGGLSIAVYKPHAHGAGSRAKRLLQDQRIDALCPADYREGSELEKLVSLAIRHIAAKAEFDQELRRNQRRA